MQKALRKSRIVAIQAALQIKLAVLETKATVVGTRADGADDVHRIVSRLACNFASPLDKRASQAKMLRTLPARMQLEGGPVHVHLANHRLAVRYR